MAGELNEEAKTRFFAYINKQDNVRLNETSTFLSITHACFVLLKRGNFWSCILSEHISMNALYPIIEGQDCHLYGC